MIKDLNEEKLNPFIHNKINAGMIKGEEFENGWTDVTMPIIGDEWQFIYKPQTDFQAELTENEIPVPIGAKRKKVKPKNKELVIGKNEFEKPTKNPIN